MSAFDPAAWDEWMQGAASPALIPARWESCVRLTDSYVDLRDKMAEMLRDGWEIARVDPCEEKRGGAYCIIARRPPKFQERNG